MKPVWNEQSLQSKVCSVNEAPTSNVMDIKTSVRQFGATQTAAVIHG